MEAADIVLPIYVFDDRVFKAKTRFGFNKTGVFRAKFIIESIIDLRNSLANIGLPLIVRSGKTENVISEIARKNMTSWVFCNRERTSEEVEIQDSVERNLWSIGQEVRYNRGKMLYYTADLPFPVTQTPDIFTHFRKEVEKIVPIRSPLSVPAAHTSYNLEIEKGDIPTIKELGYSEEEILLATNSYFRGGESAALKRLNYYLWESNKIASYKDTRNGMLGMDYSSKFSPYLAQGCLSPKKIYAEIKKYEDKVKKNDSTYWLIFELMWRDFFRLMAKKHGNKIFRIKGPKEENKKWSEDKQIFAQWSKAKTGIPFIDANMREINQTGFMSNRGRQNVASFLVNDLGINWIMGAEYFESLLVDYDPCSNYGNWNYIAGVGSDPRENRYFNTMNQAKKYDEDGRYVRHMIPEIAHLPNEYIHSPFEMNSSDENSYNLKIGEDYPAPMLDLDGV
jgi:deoxyribodipyrimidine photo-lyase